MDVSSDIFDEVVAYKTVSFLCVICFSFEKNPKVALMVGAFSLCCKEFKGFMASLDMSYYILYSRLGGNEFTLCNELVI